MKRPEQHVTDSHANALFQYIFAEWSVNPSERDYGWDYVVEVFRKGESTGFLFNGQLKGSRHTEYSADGSFVSQELEIDSADYLARQLRQPTIQTASLSPSDGRHRLTRKSARQAGLIAPVQIARKSTIGPL